MTTDADIVRLKQQVEINRQALADAGRLIAKDRRLNEPKQFVGMEVEEFAEVSKQADRAYQAQRIVPPPPANFESADMYRLRLATRLLPHAKLSRDEVTQLGRADSAHAMAQKVFDAAYEQAHHAPDLRPIVTVDRTGREITEFIGSKKSWMRDFEGPVLESAIHVDDVPQRLRVIRT